MCKTHYVTDFSNSISTLISNPHYVTFSEVCIIVTILQMRKVRIREAK